MKTYNSKNTVSISDRLMGAFSIAVILVMPTALLVSFVANAAVR